MWISDRFRGLALPSKWAPALAAFAFAFLPELARSRTGIAMDPHPGWIGVLLLAARGGSGGLLMGVVAAAAGIAVAMPAGGAGLAYTWGGLDSASNMLAFAACLAVSWVASWHLRRYTDALERQGALSERAAECQTTIEGLQEVIATLRSRVDRTWTSLSFLRNVAARLEGTDPMAAAQAAADLALARSGASAVALHHVGPRGFQRLLAVRDARGPGAMSRLEPRDADMTVSIGASPRVGTLSLWGVRPAGLDHATAHDLELIAMWCAPALTISSWRPEPAGETRRLG